MNTSDLSQIQQFCSRQLGQHLNNNNGKSALMNTLLLNRVENIVIKGEIARFDEQFLLLSQNFQKLSAAEALGSIYMRESVSCPMNASDVNPFPNTTILQL